VVCNILRSKIMKPFSTATLSLIPHSFRAFDISPDTSSPFYFLISLSVLFGLLFIIILPGCPLACECGSLTANVLELSQCLRRKSYLGEYDYGVELGVVQLVHGVRGDVQEGVESLVHDVPYGGQADYPGPLVLSSPAGILL
jgi:hypothetical protein